jgi:hypothetical protein
MTYQERAKRDIARAAETAGDGHDVYAYQVGYLGSALEHLARAADIEVEALRRELAELRAKGQP